MDDRAPGAYDRPSMKTSEIRMRDPYVASLPEEGRYLLFGTTDQDCWTGRGVGFDVYTSADLAEWEGPFPAFRPEPGFWGTTNFWAPEAHRYEGRWYLFASFKSEGRVRATQVLVADDPRGPYRPHSPEPLTPPGWECLDGTLHLDDTGEPWLVFCHEWIQTRDGEIRAQRLERDLSAAAGPPILLFRGSEAPWTRPHRRTDGSLDPGMRVTDGPFLHRTAAGELLMLWSSFSESGYAMGIARSASGKVIGPWEQEPKPVADSDSGHGMIFRSLDGRLVATWHSPNRSPFERPAFFGAEERAGTIVLGGRLD
jgi:arabinan endo-1,5-alpha-L-arabinosidase